MCIAEVQLLHGMAWHGKALVCKPCACRFGHLCLVCVFTAIAMLTAPLLPNTLLNQELRLDQMQGSGAMLAPLHSMPALRTLELASCHLNDAQALHAALRAATGLAALRIQVGGLCDQGRRAGMGSVC